MIPLLLLPWLWLSLIIIIINSSSSSNNIIVTAFITPSFQQKRSFLSDNNNDDDDLRSCPFSAAFPRYRIDLTRSSSDNGNNSNSKNNNNGPFNKLFGGFQKKALRQQLERKYATSSSFQWIEDDSSNDTHGITVFAVLWEAASNNQILQTIAFPDCDPRILVNWKEIMDWIQSSDMGSKHQGPNIETAILENGRVVQMRRTTSTTMEQQQQSNNNDNDDIVIARTKAWVRRVLVELQICPFTKSVTKSGQGLGDLGVPVGRIAYHVSSNSNIYQLLSDTWHAIDDMIQAGPSGKNGISSILLAAPGWDDDDDAVWSGPVFTVLEQCVVAARAEGHVGVVCFHPKYATPDGTSWPGFGHMHSVPRLRGWVEEEENKKQRERVREEQQRQREESQFVVGEYGIIENPDCPVLTSNIVDDDDIAAGGAWQRRTPHATINVLRADQLAVAESRRNTPQLYARNIQTLLDIGNDQLFDDLERERRMT